MNNPLLNLIFIIVVFIVGGLMYIYNPTPKSYEKPVDKGVVCTMEARACPDGSYVGRIGPNCEFAECPVASSTNTCSSGVCIGPKIPETKAI